MSVQSYDRKSERAESALNLIKNLDQSLQKINHDIALATLDFDGARRNAEYAKRIHHIYSSSDCSPVSSPSKSCRLDSEPQISSPSNFLHQISPVTKSSPRDNHIEQSLALERQQHAQTKANLEKSLQKEVELNQIIQLMQLKVNQLQDRILAAEEDAEVALDLAKNNEIHCQQLEISLKQCQIEKDYLEAKLKQRLDSENCEATSCNKESIEINRSLSSPSQRISEINVNRAMITCGREILQKRRQGRGSITSPTMNPPLPPLIINGEKNISRAEDTVINA